MKIAIAHENGQVADANTCPQYLMISVENGEPVGKELVDAPSDSATAALTFLSMTQTDVLICGALSVAMRNALEMLGIILVPGVSGSAEEAAAKFIIGEKQGDPGILEICREEDPDDPMSCMHDCSRCAGCGPVQVPLGTEEHLPKI